MRELDQLVSSKFIDSGDVSECSKIHASTFALVYDTARQFASSIAAKGQLATDLAALAVSLKPYSEPANWLSDKPGEYIFFRPTPSMDNVKIVSITVKPRKFAVEEGPSLKIEEGTPVTRSLRFRRFARIVPEISGAVIKTDLRFPKYEDRGREDDCGERGL